ncbi:hypothetical protein [Nocardioides humi]|uniref:Uncharacterized protein n=1 Tax=Nocardioides humi TaxID=449461 RepID=A0ABN2AJ49_9ACTN|nr:hypothetical protein [Nocardioides humi]
MDFHITRPGIVVPVCVDPAGLTGPTPGQARGRRWRTTSTNRFVPAHVTDESVDQRIVEALAGAPDGSAVTGWAAFCWQRARWFEGLTASGERRPVPVALGDQSTIRRRQGVELRHGWLLDGDVIHVDGLPLTRPERATYDAVLRSRNLEEAAQIVAMACACDLVSLHELATYRARIRGRQHTRRLADAIELADENLWSPMEATMLFSWLETGCRRPLCNVPIFDRAGRHLLTPDLLDPVAGVVGQYDGRVHDLTTVRRRDLAKEERCRELGLEVVTMLSTDLRDRRAFERRLAAAYVRAGRRSLGDFWTIDQPAWWVDTSTVARRRALDDEDRQRWLRRGAA